MEEKILYADDPKNRDLKIVKTCSVCGVKYHPRNNSYQGISSYCSKKCFRAKGKKKLY